MATSPFRPALRRRAGAITRLLGSPDVLDAVGQREGELELGIGARFLRRGWEACREREHRCACTQAAGRGLQPPRGPSPRAVRRPLSTARTAALERSIPCFKRPALKPNVRKNAADSLPDQVRATASSVHPRPGVVPRACMWYPETEMELNFGIF